MGDLEFVQKCSSGDSSSWNEFLDRYSRLIYNYIYNVLIAKNCPDVKTHAQDVFQEIIHSLIRDDYTKLKSYKARNGCSLASWLRVVTVNFTLRYVERLKPAVSLEEEIGEGLSLKDALAADLDPARETLSDREKAGHLQDCIAGLSTEDKYFLELYLNQGLSLTDLMKAFRIARAAVDMRKSRLIKRLKECFRRKGFELDS
ncbi:MAG: sigma-70 family RNA polymerase sigma factor [Candidatus Omnitrophica bacterium]|nr:sigma-70 family RNA polymerase sigma factor [Candidatus Omnitrophota bacterium]